MGLALVVAALVAIAWPEHFLATLATVAVYVGTAGGPGVAVPAGLALGLPVAYVCVLLWAVDVAFSLLFALAIPVEAVKRRIPRVARGVARLHARIARTRSARWSLVAAVAFWVGLPIHSGGAIVGTVAARACGLPAPVTVATVSGAAAVRMLAWALAWTGVVHLALG